MESQPQGNPYNLLFQNLDKLAPYLCPLSRRFDIEREPANDVDRDFILDGLHHGFTIVDDIDFTCVITAEVENSKTVLSPGLCTRVEQQIITEMSLRTSMNCH
jgi:hypothetical protein